MLLLPLPGVLALFTALVVFCWRVGRKRELDAWPNLISIAGAAVRSLAKGKRARAGIQPPLEVALKPAVAIDTARLASLLRVARFGTTATSDVPVMFPIAQAFRLNLALMFLPDFPVGVVGSVLARNRTLLRRPLTARDRLLFKCALDPHIRKTEKGDLELDLINSGTDPETGSVVWENHLTVIVLSPTRKRGAAGAKPAAAGSVAPEPWRSMEEWAVGGDAGWLYGAINGDLNPIHLHPLASQLFGFKRPIAHALFLVTRAEAALRRAGVVPQYPTVLETEFKRPTLLPAKLKCGWRVESREAAAAAVKTAGGLPFAVLTEDMQKEVLVGRWYSTVEASSS